jgi:hypothetical protein
MGVFAYISHMVTTVNKQSSDFGIVAICAVVVLSLGCGGSSDSGTTSPQSADSGSEGGITGLAQSEWKWVPIEGAFCRDGTATGIGVNLGSRSDKLMVYLEGGNVCFDATTCQYMNPKHFDENDFKSQIGLEGSAGIFNRNDAKNPVADWSFAYIPYCTGDIHSGNNPSGNVPGLGPQKFVGYVNVSKALEHVVPTFPGLSQVLLTGTSAGGFGAAANYVQVAKAFGSVPVYMLDDSGPAMENPYNATCLQQNVITLWGEQNGSLKDCDGMCNNPASYLLDFVRHIATAYPSVPFGLIESTRDSVISLFFGFGTDDGKNDCMGGVTTPEDPSLFTAGLEDLNQKTKDLPNVGAFIFDGTQHTSLLTTLDTQSTPASGVPDSGPDVKLVEWVTQLLAGHISTVGLPPAASATDGGLSEGGTTDAGAME